jgi:hypothetical protein
MIEKQISCPVCKQIITVKGRPLEKIVIICPLCNTKGIYQFEDDAINNTNDFKSIIKILFLFFLTSILMILSIFIFQTSDLFLLIISFILIPIIIMFRFDLRILFIYALSLIVLSAIGLAFYKDNMIANQLTTNSYWLIVVGVLCYFMDSLQKYGKLRNQKSVC